MIECIDRSAFFCLEKGLPAGLAEVEMIERKERERDDWEFEGWNL